MYENRTFEHQKTSKTADNFILKCAIGTFDEKKAIAKKMKAKDQKLHKL